MCLGMIFREVIEMTKKLTLNKVIEQFKEVHGDEYNYDKVIYINTRTKIIITCNIHGDFLQTPMRHKNNGKCPRCSGVKKPPMDEMIKILYSINENIEIIHVDYVRNVVKCRCLL